MAFETLKRMGKIEGARILGVGAGQEITIYELAAAGAEEVIASDIYLDHDSEWAHWWEGFLKDPMSACPAHLKTQVPRGSVLAIHADMTDLPFRSDSFDAVFSSGSIEHVGQPNTPDYGAIQKAATEIGRVLKPGGVATLSTEWKLKGDGWGWGHVRLFDESNIYTHIIEPSGCTLIDEPNWVCDEPLTEYVVLKDLVEKRASEKGFVVLREHDFFYTSVHLAMQKKPVGNL